MEPPDHSRFVDRRDKSPAPSIGGTFTSGQNEEVAKDPNMSPQKQGLGNRPTRVEDKYVRLEATIPKDDDFDTATRSHAEKFLEEMIACQNSIKDPCVRPLDLTGVHSWDEVMRLVKDKEDAYLKAGQNGLRAMGRSMTAHSKSVTPYLRLIPNGFFTSIAASNISIEREKVHVALLRIPDVIIQAERSVETFSPDPILSEKAEQLYLAILGAIEWAAKWLTQHPLGKPARAMAAGPQYNKHFNQKLDALDRALDALRDRASILRDSAIVTTKGTVLETQTVVMRLAKTGEDVDVKTQSVLHGVHSLQEQTKDLKVVAEHTGAQVSYVSEGISTFTKTQNALNGKIDDVHNSQQASHVKIDGIHGVQEAIYDKVEVLSDVQQALAKAAKALEIAGNTAKWRAKDGRNIHRLKQRLKRLEDAADGLDPADLLNILNISAEAPSEDFRRLHRACQSVEPSDSQIAQGVFEGARFSKWFDEDDSAALFIEGGPILADLGRFASLTLMSCLLIKYLEGKEPAISIYHFCGRHISSRDPIQGPQGLMRSLIFQVVRLFDSQVNLSFATSHRYREQLKSHSIRTLCECFASIIKQLPPETVLFCIIDNIDCFEKPQWAEDCRFVIREIQDLLYEDEVGPVFKLLVTSPGRSRYVGATFTSQCRLLLSSAGFAGRNNPTEREMSMGARRSRVSGGAVSQSSRNMFPQGLEEYSDGLSDSDSSWGSGHE